MSDEHANCGHGHGHHVHGKALNTALIIAFVFMIVEVIGGIVANSLALISDALHMFTDVGALGLSLVVLKIAHLPSTPKMSYGYHRAEILGALASALSLWALCGVLIYEAILRLIAPPEVKGPIVFVIATFGLLANLMMMRTLHSHQDENLNIRAAYLHVIGDLLGSVGVILGGAILWITGWNPIDPIISILFSLGILYGSGKIIKQTVSVLMESTPEGIDPVAISNDLASIPGVREVHDLHIWAVSAKKVALSAHLIADDTQAALREAHRRIEQNYKISHMTIQVEDPAHFEPRYCYDCDNGRSKR
ncbi:MAG: cation transporter [Verrucomicrobia bacterium]|nr:cation transporter [Verrucomicrobiota bacterium]